MIICFAGDIIVFVNEQVHIRERMLRGTLPAGFAPWTKLKICLKNGNYSAPILYRPVTEVRLFGSPVGLESRISTD